ncbi:MAG: CUAEP/CCAEP-tail radical SAM protein [Pseudomonadota bacterium]
MRVTLISPYELGRQPFGLAHPAALLRERDVYVDLIDLAQARLIATELAASDLIGVHLPMHTATRIAAEVLPSVRAAAPGAVLCAYGMYAPLNAGWLRDAGVDLILGAEFETGLLTAVDQLKQRKPPTQPVLDGLPKVSFVVPDRTGLAPLSAHAQLRRADGSEMTMGFAETTRGCKHRCRHCPVVPAYNGRFRAIPAAVVLEDIRAQVAAGAGHVSFGDPDFLNGPAHALRIAEQLHREFPDLTFDAVIKVEHLLRHQETVARLGVLGMTLVISAVESIDDDILERLDKGHTHADFVAVVALMRNLGIALAPTFVAFTPWTTLESYAALLEELNRLELVASVPPVQLAIRLLIPAGSRLLELPEVRALAGPFDQSSLGHPWTHADPRVDALQHEIETSVSEPRRRSRSQVFAWMLERTYAAIGADPPALAVTPGRAIAHHTEHWYC